MNWLRKLLGYRDHEYRADDFSVRIEPIFREGVSVIYTRQGKSLTLTGERIGRRWEGIGVRLPTEIEATQVPQIVRDLEAAFVALKYHYVITRKTGVDTAPEAEREAAIAELRKMGYEIGDSARPQDSADSEGRCTTSGSRNSARTNATHDLTNTISQRNTSALRDSG